VEYISQENHHTTLAILERFAENQGNARDYTLEYLERFLDECRTGQGLVPEDRHHAYQGLIKTMGLRTAEFHRALALDAPDGGFGSEPISAEDISAWVSGVRTQMENMYELLDLELPQLPHEVQNIGNNLLAERPRLFRRIMRAAAVKLDAVKTRYHGDYHLGQLWLSSNDFLITNFGGNPAKPWSERRRRHSPLRDVASMMLSFSEVGTTALDHVTADSADVEHVLRNHINAWEALTHQTFFRSYRKAMAKHPAHPSEGSAAEALMVLFMAEKAIAAVHGELLHRSTTVGASMRRLLSVALRRR